MARRRSALEWKGLVHLMGCDSVLLGNRMELMWIRSTALVGPREEPMIRHSVVSLATLALLLVSAAGLRAEPAVVPLSPNNGGRMIQQAVLEPGDLIVSTTKSTSSWVIRKVTDSEVSHVMIYAGLGFVIEVVPGDGVRQVTLEEALKDASLAVAVRPKLSQSPERLVEVARKYIGKGYDWFGAALAPRVMRSTSDPVAHRIIQGNDKLYCSELVFQAFADIGMSFGQDTRSVPQDVVTQFRLGIDLVYVGHLLHKPR